jgi:hypothetical protein
MRGKGADMRTRKFLLVLALMLVVVALCGAEEQYGFLKTGIQGGLNFNTIDLNDFSGEMYSIGAQVHILPWLSVRGSFSLYSTQQQFSDTVAATAEYLRNESSLMGGGGAVLLHLIRFDSGSFYLGPMVSTWSQKTTYHNTDGSTSEIDYYNDLQLGAIVGGQWMLGKGFALYGEGTFVYSMYSYGYDTWNALGTHTGSPMSDYNRFFFKGATIGFIAYLN